MHENKFKNELFRSKLKTKIYYVFNKKNLCLLEYLLS